MNKDDEFSAWYGATYPKVLASVTLATSANQARAEDAANEAFLRAYERWDDVRLFESASGWVTKVAINAAKKTFRVSAYRLFYRIGRPARGQLHPISYDPALWDAVRKLPERQREAIVLRYVEDLTQEQISSQLGMAAGTAAATLSHARGNLRNQLEESHGDEKR